MKIVISIIEEDAYEIFEKQFSGISNEHVQIVNKPLFDIDGEFSALVSSANSFGYMDGGFDQEISNNIPGIQEIVQDTLSKTEHSELCVGTSKMVYLNNRTYKGLLVTPTMRIPKDVSDTMNAYHAMRGMLQEAIKHNLGSIIMPTLCTGTGRMTSVDAARQMYEAWMSISEPRLLNWDDTIDHHHYILTGKVRA